MKIYLRGSQQIWFHTLDCIFCPLRKIRMSEVNWNIFGVEAVWLYFMCSLKNHTCKESFKGMDRTQKLVQLQLVACLDSCFLKKRASILSIKKFGS